MRPSFRMVFVAAVAAILLVVGVQVAKVHLVRRDMAMRHETQRLQLERVALRRELADRHVRLGYVTSPEAVMERAQSMALDLTDEVVDGELASVYTGQD